MYKYLFNLKIVLNDCSANIDCASEKQPPDVKAIPLCTNNTHYNKSA